MPDIIEEKIVLNTFDESKLLVLQPTFYVDGYFTFRVRMKSSSFSGISSFCASSNAINEFSSLLNDIYDRLSGEAILSDNDSDGFISFEGKANGSINVEGLIGGSHRDQYAKIAFISDQTCLKSFIEPLQRLVDKYIV